MYKQEFIRYLSKKNKRHPSFYIDAINEVLEGITEQLRAGESVHFIGFGSFKVRTKKGGKAIDFKTKKEIKYKDYRQVFFYEGDTLKQAVRRK